MKMFIKSSENSNQFIVQTLEHWKADTLDVCRSFLGHFRLPPVDPLG